MIDTVSANECRNHCEAKGATSMRETTTYHQPRFVAEEPENFRDRYRLIRPGQTHFVTIEEAVLCPGWIKAEDAIRLAGGLMVEVGADRALVRGGASKSQAPETPRPQLSSGHSMLTDRSLPAHGNANLWSAWPWDVLM
jgi:hypothetical protein